MLGVREVVGAFGSYADRVPTGSRRALLRPKWLGLHLLVVVALCVMVRLGFWQWSVGEATGALRNYSYGLEWWAFAALSLVGWIKFCLDETAPAAGSPSAAGATAPVRPAAEIADPVRQVPSQTTTSPAAPVADDEDPEVAAWNARFAELARRDAESSS